MCLAVDIKGTLLMVHEFGQRDARARKGRDRQHRIDRDRARQPARAEYAAGKYGVLGITKSYAKAFAPHVRVNTFAPGFMQTEAILNRPDWTSGRAEQLTARHADGPDPAAGGPRRAPRSSSRATRPIHITGTLHDLRRRLQHARRMNDRPVSDGVPGTKDEPVYDRVRAAILNGELAPGAIMSQVSLAEELGISRTPLREALRMLQSEGLIEAEPNRRVRVAPMTPNDLEDLWIIRVTLETEALRLSMPRMTADDLARLEGSMAEMAHYAEIKDYRRWGVPHRRFHRLLTVHAGERLNALLDQLFDHSERYRRLHIGHGPSAWATAGHREILDACK